MRRALIIVSGALTILGACVAFASDGAGGQGAAFLRVPTGVRPAGMGGAFTSVADDVDALYFNPAGLHQVRGVTASASYSLLSMDRTHYEAGVVVGSDGLGTVGLVTSGFRTGGIGRRNEVGELTGTFDDVEMAFTLGYGKKLLGPVGLGGSVRYIAHSLASNGATGFGFDLGMHSRLDFEGDVVKAWRSGVSASNLAASLKWDTASEHEDEIPLTVRYGTSVDVEPGGLHLLVACEGWSTANEPTELHAGLELWVHESLALRSGYSDGDITFGAGIRISSLAIDYAYRPDVLDEGATHGFGMSGEF